jgi:hypothetical protein
MNRAIPWLLGVYFLVAAWSVLPVGEFREARERLRAGWPPPMSWPASAEFERALGPLGAGGGPGIWTFGKSGGEITSGFFLLETCVNHALLPSPPMVTREMPATPPAEARVLVALEPFAFEDVERFRREFPYRAKVNEVWLASREPLPVFPGKKDAEPLPGPGLDGLVGGLLLCALLVLPGWIVLRRLEGSPIFGIASSIAAAWCLGWFVTTHLQWLAAVVFGIPFSTTLWMVIGAAVLVLGSRWPGGNSSKTHFFPKCAHNEPSRYPGIQGWLAVAGVSMLVLVASLYVALSLQNDSPAALTNWGYKAKLIHLLNDWPEGWHSIYDGPNRQTHYPPGFAFLCAVFYQGADQVSEFAVRCLPPLLLAGSFAVAVAMVIRRCGRMAWLLVPGLLGAWMNAGGITTVSAFYAEPLLAMALLLALARLNPRVHDAGADLIFWLLLAAAAWTKPEGLFFYAMALGLLPWLAWQSGGGWASARKAFLRGVVVGAVAIAPWWLHVIWQSPESSRSEWAWDPERLHALLAAMREHLLPRWHSEAVLGWLALPALAVGCWKRDRMSLIALALGFGYLAAVLLKGAISNAPVEHFVIAMARVLWLPGILFAIAMIPAFDPQKDQPPQP